MLNYNNKTQLKIKLHLLDKLQKWIIMIKCKELCKKVIIMEEMKFYLMKLFYYKNIHS